MNFKSLQPCQSALLSPFQGGNRSVQRYLLVLATASFFFGIFGLQLCFEKNGGPADYPATAHTRSTDRQAETGKWSYDELAHKLIFEYCEKSRQEIQEGFSYKLGRALVKVSRKMRVMRPSGVIKSRIPHENHAEFDDNIL